MKEENLDYIEAIKFLCDKSGINFPDDEIDDEILKFKSQIYEINKTTAKYYHEKLMSNEGKNALEYLFKRGFDIPIIKKFGLGFAPDSWNKTTEYLSKQGYNQTVILQAWLGGKSQMGSIYDQFRNRVMFPIFDLRGNVVAFSGRTLSKDDSRKYLNSGDTPVFKKSKNLFAMNFAKKTKKENIIICEGNLDVVAVHKAGFDNCVATLGTAMTSDHARLLSMYTNEVVLAYDSDEAGVKATKRAIDILSSVGLKAKVLTLNDAKDPDEYIKKFGNVRFAKLIEGSNDAVGYQLEKLKTNYNFENLAQKAEYIKKAVEIIALLSFIERDIYASKLSEELNVDKQAILYEIKSFLNKKKRREHSEQKKDFSIADLEKRDLINPQRNTNYKAAKAEENIIACIFKFNEAYKEIKNKISFEDFVTEFNKNVYKEICNLYEINQAVDIAMLYGKFIPEEISKITGMIAKYSQTHIGFDISEIDEFIKTIKEDKNKLTGDDIKKLENVDLVSFINKLKEDKK
ncbi:MAG: DNA primase [Oscillospiraceae bacterium]